MANWSALSLAGGTQPIVVGSVNSHWIVDTPTDQGDIRTALPGITSIYNYYVDQNVIPLNLITNDNVSLFVGFPTDANLATAFEIRNDNTLLVYKGRMQPLIKFNEASPFNAQFTIYCPHKDIAPINHTGLIEAFTVEFNNGDIGNPNSGDAINALVGGLTERMQNYDSVGGVNFAGDFANDFMDQNTSLFAKGGFMTYADNTLNGPYGVIPVV
jgi:hypothetical protein